MKLSGSSIQENIFLLEMKIVENKYKIEGFKEKIILLENAKNFIQNNIDDSKREETIKDIAALIDKFQKILGSLEKEQAKITSELNEIKKNFVFIKH